MSGARKSKSPDVAAYYDKAAAAVPELTVLNYGYSAPERTLVPSDEPEFYCLRLYEHAVRAVSLRGARVLEVSCGRGGGARFLARAFGPAAYVGVDLSEENLRIARAGGRGTHFLLGNAQHLPFRDGAFDIVINIEASHLYDDRTRFFAEAHRVLAPGGHFCYADGCWASDDCTRDLLDAGFELLERREITANVIQALEQDNGRRAALFDAIPDAALSREYKDWGGVVGYRAYNRFAGGETLYFSHLLRRSRGQHFV